MRRELYKKFFRYAMIGLMNTAVHWAVFLVVYYFLRFDQVLSNTLAFCVAVTFSFFMNARFTFDRGATGARYVSYVAFMGALSAVVGASADQLQLHPVFTLIFFSVISLVVGFFYSKLVVFREKN